jgi:hypothetical protein
METRSGTWLFAIVWLALTATSAVRLYVQWPDRSAVALFHWGTLGTMLLAPLYMLWWLHARLGSDPRTRTLGLRIVLMSYLPLWIALRLLERSLLP